MHRCCLLSTGSIHGGPISKIDGEAGKFLMEYLRKGGTTAIKLSLINEILAHIEQEKPSPPVQKQEERT